MGLLKELWEKTQEALDENKRKKQLKNLRLQGEVTLRKMEIELDNAVGAMENAIIKERDKQIPDYETLVTAHENMRIVKEKFELGKEMFKELFGEDPDFVS